MPGPTEQQLLDEARKNQRLFREAQDAGVRQRSLAASSKAFSELDKFRSVPSMSEEQAQLAPSGPSDDDLRASARANERIVQTTPDKQKKLEGQIILQRIYDELDRRGSKREGIAGRLL